jgi:ribonuclease PH
MGQTVVWCSASIEDKVPAWRQSSGKGWLTAEYGMLPGSTSPRAPRERQRLDVRTNEIQRLIGRSLRAVIRFDALGERTILVDCDVLRADGGTRTASITGALIAVVDALRSIPEFSDTPRMPLISSVAAVSVGIVDGTPLLDLDYEEDVRATVDMNVVMTGNGKYVELQGTGEEAVFDDRQLGELLCLAQGGIQRLTEIQGEALGNEWPFPT